MVQLERIGLLGADSKEQLQETRRYLYRVIEQIEDELNKPSSSPTTSGGVSLEGIEEYVQNMVNRAMENYATKTYVTEVIPKLVDLSEYATEDFVNSAVDDLNSVIGSTDISEIGDGTITGAIAKLESAIDSSVSETEEALANLPDTYEYLYRGGSFYSIGGLSVNVTGGGAEYVFKPNHIVLHTPASTDASYVGLLANNTFDNLSSYTKIGILYEYVGPTGLSLPNGFGPCLGFADSNGYYSSEGGQVTLNTASVKTTKTEYLNIKHNSGYTRLSVQLWQSDNTKNQEHTWKIYAIWLE